MKKSTATTHYRKNGQWITIRPGSIKRPEKAVQPHPFKLGDMAKSAFKVKFNATHLEQYVEAYCTEFAKHNRRTAKLDGEQILYLCTEIEKHINSIKSAFIKDPLKHLTVEYNDLTSGDTRDRRCS